MIDSTSRHYDLAIVGGGPVGSVCAIAHARKGARVALLEANPKASHRLAGEWLHPPAVRILQDLGIHFNSQFNCTTGKGFVVFPEDFSDPIMLPYSKESRGLVLEHSTLISRLHEAVLDESNIDFIMPARVRAVEEDRVIYTAHRDESFVAADRIIGADGRASVVRKSLGMSTALETCSRMVGAVVDGVNLPLVGYGHVLLGGPGPILVYQLAEQRVRVVADVPLDHWAPRDRIALIIESYADLLPESIRTQYVETLRNGNIHVAANELKPRINYGKPDRVLIGDAAGHYHPLTAIGMTLGFDDAIALAEIQSFEKFKTNRFHKTRAPEFLAMGLYELFADYRIEAVEVRHAIYRNWRSNAAARDRTVAQLACEDTSAVRLGFSFSILLFQVIGKNLRRLLDTFARRRFRDITFSFANRLIWLLRGVSEQKRLRKTDGTRDERSRELLSGAFIVSMPPAVRKPPHQFLKEVELINVEPALQSATQSLLNLQAEDGSWEGEMVWCPMLTAQYVLLHHIIGQPLAPARRQLVLRQFNVTRLEGGLWGMHEHAPPSLFVTTLVYVAARLLDIDPNDPLVEPARKFIRSENVVHIPSWGKFWLALLNLYDWQGVNAIIPELWSFPHWIPFHPSNWYCHTRLIYMAMAVIYSKQYQVPIDPLIAALREELYPQGFENVKFSRSRNLLRTADLFAPPSRWLKVGYGLTRFFDRVHAKKLRGRCVNELIQRIKWELQTTSHTSISPVSGILNIIAVWLSDPNDPDFKQALAQMDGWIWEDEENGTRVTGARSASWDSGFCLQALSTVPIDDRVKDSLQRGVEFLYQQQINHSFAGFREACRNDPKGGWCFAGGWHGWPVTDCTAEAVLGIISVEREAASSTVLQDAIQFMLRGQNRNGGFGSYESQRSRIGLEWLNPAEMFGESMTEHSFIECTASCMAAIAACKEYFPQLIDESVADSISRADAWLRRTQLSDGSWRGVWGIQYIYGTLFGIRGLLAAQAPRGDPALRLACRWLLSHQHPDGGWGEHHSGSLSGKYVAHEESQVIQTAWALIALLEAGDSNWIAISRGIQFLLNTQNADGTWPKQDMAGVFFRTALLDYVLYRHYFPLHALSLYAKRRNSRLHAENSADTEAEAA